MNGRLLLLSFHFGPGCETGGLRWNAMAAALARTGVAVDVLTAARPGYDRPYEFVPGVRVTPIVAPTWFRSLMDLAARLKRSVFGIMRGRESRSSQSPDSAPAIRKPSGGRRSLYGRVMGNLDAVSTWSAERGWATRAFRAGLRSARTRPVTGVVVSSPPHHTQLAGTWLARKLAVPFVADFRDPWNFAGPDIMQTSLLHRSLGNRAQHTVLGSVSLVVCNTEWARELVTVHDDLLDGRAIAIPNGYDPREVIATPDPSLFRVSYVGWLYDFMDPEPVLAACARLWKRENLRELRVEFVGTDPLWQGAPLAAIAAAAGIGEHFEHRPRVSREEALAIQDRSAVSVVFDVPSPYRVPMKFYDVMQTRGSPLLIGNPESAMGDAAARAGCEVCRSGDAAAIDRVLTGALARWRRREYPAPIDRAGVFARWHRSEEMTRALQSVGAIS